MNIKFTAEVPTELIPGLAKRGQPTVLPVLKIIDNSH